MKMKRHIWRISIMLAAIMIFSASIICAQDAMELILQIDNPIMTVNGIEKEIDPGRGTAPILRNNRTLLPVRAIVEEMGGTVGWKEETQEVTLSYGNDTILLAIGSETAYLNGEAKALDVAPVVLNYRTLLPIRFIAEWFGFGVVWNGEEQTVTVSKAIENENIAEAAQARAIVVYFSATGNTKSLAQTIGQATGAELFEIVPEQPYTSADLNYSNDGCRANREMNDDSSRPAISGTVENIDNYDTIFIGYPIW
ncbi:MAG: flavodoxin, partial [Clostridia bacterium]|nr:flavodoxin [Clostridia bacterium]